MVIIQLETVEEDGNNKEPTKPDTGRQHGGGTADFGLRSSRSPLVTALGSSGASSPALQGLPSSLGPANGDLNRFSTNSEVIDSFTPRYFR